MKTTAITVIIAVLIIWGLFFLMIVRAKLENRKNVHERIKNSWGNQNPRLFSADQMNLVRQYSDSLPGPEVDDITANDLDLTSVYGRICGAFSSAGEEVLYAWLRHPLTEEDQIRERSGLIRHFEEDEEARGKILAILSELSYVRGNSFYGYIRTLDHAEPIGTARFIAASFATLAALVMLFFFPLPAVIALTVLLFFDYQLHIGMKEKTSASLKGFHTILRLMDAAEKIAALPDPALSSVKKDLTEILGRFRVVRRGAFMLMSAGAVGTGLGDAVLEYICLFFHPDLILYDRMLSLMKMHGEDSVRLLELTGSLDAAVSAASYRAGVQVFTEPCFVKSGDLFLHAEGLVHPLIQNPVPNSIQADRAVLFTGSNASGKSTFLKASALAALMGQSICTVLAESYRAPLFRVMTSMSLTDDVSGGDSYFMAEIKSLRRIFDEADEEGPPVFALIDEVLRGTNTTERIAASSQILKKMAQMPGLLVFAATHDLELTFLLEEICENMHFEEHVEGDDVRFDYLLREGRANTRNAILLLKLIGYDDDLTENASQMASRFEKEGSWTLV